MIAAPEPAAPYASDLLMSAGGDGRAGLGSRAKSRRGGREDHAARRDPDGWLLLRTRREAAFTTSSTPRPSFWNRAFLRPLWLRSI